MHVGKGQVFFFEFIAALEQLSHIWCLVSKWINGERAVDNSKIFRLPPVCTIYMYICNIM